MTKLKRSILFLIVVTLLPQIVTAQLRLKNTQNVIVYKDQGRFCGWPANNGVWSWGNNEILVGFTLGYYKADENGHSINNEKEMYPVFARSLDGGESWHFEDNSWYRKRNHELSQCQGGINFAHPDFVMRTDGHGWHTGREGFNISYDRGKNWQGPYELHLPPNSEYNLSEPELTPRTDYLINNADDCFFFLSMRDKNTWGSDRTYCARTVNSGRSVDFVSWVNPEKHTIRGVMPSTVRCSENKLVTALRRKKIGGKNWIDVFESTDNGQSWRFISKVADTDLEEDEHNGNPPSMIRLEDGRLCVTYGYRSADYGIRAKLSNDDGKSWGKEIILRDDARNWDIGYTRTVQREDGKIITIYYYTTEKNIEQHIAATIWDAPFSLTPPKNGDIYVVAHRGVHQGIPENTLPAYQKAIDLGCDFVEIDVRTTKDGKFVSIHNDEVDKYASGISGKVKDFTYKELRKIDIGHKTGKEWAGTQIPSFEEILDLCKDKIGIYLDLKDAPVEPLVKLIQERDMENQVLWCLSEYVEMEEVDKYCPECLIMPDPGSETPLKTILKTLKPRIVAPVWREFSKELVETSRAHGAMVFVDEKGKESWETALNYGAKGIQTDNPEELIRFLQKRYENKKYPPIN